MLSPSSIIEAWQHWESKQTNKLTAYADGYVSSQVITKSKRHVHNLFSHLFGQRSAMNHFDSPRNTFRSLNIDFPRTPRTSNSSNFAPIRRSLEKSVIKVVVGGINF